jgi:hypothetical protein
LPQNKQDYQNLFVIFILSFSVYIIGMFNSDTAGRNYILLFIIIFFNCWEIKFKAILFFLFCLIWFGFYGFLDFRLFSVSDKHYGFIKMDFVNVNPKHDLKFISYYKVPSSSRNRSNMIGVFKSLKQTADRFSLEYNDIVVLCDVFNYAPFVLNSKMPVPSIHDYYQGATQNSLSKLPEGVDVFITCEDRALNTIPSFIESIPMDFNKHVVWEFKALLEKDDRYVIFYRDGYINYWGRKDWLERKGIGRF